MILNFLEIAAKLKTIPRQGWIDKLSIKEPESVADHSFSMAVMGMIFSDLGNYDTEKILKMILLHDLAESLTGDFTPDQKPKDEKINLENEAFEKIIKNLPKTLQKKYKEIWNEYQKNQSKESKFVHEIDKLEMALQAKIYAKSKSSSKEILTFFKSAEKKIKNPNLLNLFNEICDK